MIHWLLDSLKLRPDDALVIVYDPGFMGTTYWEPVTSASPNVSLVQLPGPTRGAAETVLLGLRGISRNLRSRPVMLVDGDTFYEEDIVSAYRDICATSNAVYYFEDTQPKPLYSYIVFDSSHRISQVKEKVKISDHANTGCYCFMRGVGAPLFPPRAVPGGLFPLAHASRPCPFRARGAMSGAPRCELDATLARFSGRVLHVGRYCADD